ncbi:MAG: von Willebrand factor type A domain-containing protein [Planctomycetaceae bacterium]|nr:von Willebrand factor type A domain-containing protein [Planctomycetaceae bacterium]
MNEELHNIPIEPELEARIVALVLGEASDFETDELNRLIAERPELAAFKLQMEQIHGSLKEVSRGEVDSPEAEWKLSAERRSVVMAVIRGESAGAVANASTGHAVLSVETKSQVTEQQPLVATTRLQQIRLMFSGSLAPAANSVLRRFRKTPVRIAAGLCVAGLLGVVSWRLLLVSYRQEANSEMFLADAEPAPTSDFRSIAGGTNLVFETKSRGDNAEIDRILADVEGREAGAKPQASTALYALQQTLTEGEVSARSSALDGDSFVPSSNESVAGAKSDAEALSNAEQLKRRLVEVLAANNDAPADNSQPEQGQEADQKSSGDAEGLIAAADMNQNSLSRARQFAVPGVASGPAGIGGFGGGGRGGALPESSAKGSDSKGGDFKSGEARLGGESRETWEDSAKSATPLARQERSLGEVSKEQNGQTFSDVSTEGAGASEESVVRLISPEAVGMKNATGDVEVRVDESGASKVPENARPILSVQDNTLGKSIEDRTGQQVTDEVDGLAVRENTEDKALKTLVEMDEKQSFGDLSSTAPGGGGKGSDRSEWSEVRRRMTLEKKESDLSQPAGAVAEKDIVMGNRFQAVDDFVDNLKDEAKSELQSDPAPAAPEKPTSGADASELPESLESKELQSPAIRGNRIAVDAARDKVAKEAEPESSINLRGEINVDTMQDLGILILKGNEADVSKVEEVIKQKETDDYRARIVAPPASLNELNAAAEAFSTFSLHVSDVSFKLAAAALAKGEWPEADKIRVEEFVNAFDYGDPLPGKNERVACAVEQGIHPFLQQRNVLRVSMRTSAEGRATNTPLRLTFVLDNSGSMERADRQQTVRRAFSLLSQQLTAIDQVTLISFSRQPRLLAENVSGNESGKLVQLMEQLPSEGGTNIEAALQLAFEKAASQKTAGAQHRIVLLTDGAVNLGNANPESLSHMVESMREAGIAFDAAGISADGLNDEVMEALTRKGDGRYYLLDSQEDADDNFAQQIAGALRPSASNVKVQVEFNPKRVGQYKLLGFEKHLLKQEDFRNDAIDAAEMAAAEAGVAMYQFEAKPDGEGDVGTVSVRFRDLATGEMIEQRWPIPYEPNAARLDQASPSLRVATTAAMLAAKLKGEPLGASVDLPTLSSLIDGLPSQTQSQTRIQQLKAMIEQARQLGEK